MSKTATATKQQSAIEMADKVIAAQSQVPTATTENAVPALRGPRLPYHPAIQERFGVDRASWKALVEAIFPSATSTESVVLALSYCKARGLDPFKRNVHIVPIYSKELGGMVDTVWPGIGELRTTAFRTGEYTGRGPTDYGPDITKKIGALEVTFPEWASLTVYRTVKGQRVAFAGPRVYWLETYATRRRDEDTPNDMWRTRPRGQLEKCAEAAALRAAFPEEVGSDYINDEVEHSRMEHGRVGIARQQQQPAIDVESSKASKPATLDELTAKLEQKQAAESGISREALNEELISASEMQETQTP